MIDLRLYRYALLAVPLVAVIAMFSLQNPPPSLSGGVPPDAFDPTSAAPLAKRLAEASAYPTPGSAADSKMADEVKSQFSAIDGATVSEQRFDGSFKGHDVHLRNLIATLPGESNRQIALIAPRDVAEGSGAVDHRGIDRRDARDREQLLGLRPSQDPGLRLHRRLEHRRPGRQAVHSRLQRRRAARCSDRAEPAGRPAPAGPPGHPLVDGAQSTASQLDDTANSIRLRGGWRHPRATRVPSPTSSGWRCPAGAGGAGAADQGRACRRSVSPRTASSR